MKHKNWLLLLFLSTFLISIVMFFFQKDQQPINNSDQQLEIERLEKERQQQLRLEKERQQQLRLREESLETAGEMYMEDSFESFSSIPSTYNFLPLNRKKQQLPHDGLFIRRNNQFGTTLRVGIKELIEQGILIDQTNIRFDDFIALNSQQVPLPKQNNTLAASYGITEIPPNQKQYTRATHYLEIALKTAEKAPSGHNRTQDKPVNYVFVIDTSGSMAGEKLKAIKLSVIELFKTLKKDDVIGVIEFNGQPRTVLKATPVKKIKTSELSKIISNITASGGTDLNIGVSFGIDEVSRYKSNNTLNQVYLFSDGNPTSGETEWINIRKNIDIKTRGNVRLSTFAFGSDANTRELDALAGLTGGKSTFVTDPDDIEISLQEELSRREHLAAINVQFKIDISRDIPIIHLYGHDLITDPVRRAAVLQDVKIAKDKAEQETGVISEPDLVTQEKGIRIFVPDLAVGETYWIVFELAIPDARKLTDIGSASIQYTDTFKRQNQTHNLDLSSPGNLPPNLVIEHALGLWTSEVAFYVLDDLYQQDLETATKRIKKHADVLGIASKNLESEAINDDSITMKKFLSLAQNLGKAETSSDAPLPKQPVILVKGLNKFGRSRNGFLRVNYAQEIAPSP